MARKKLKLAWIANDTKRKATFTKRKKGLMKKMEELTVLCGVEASAVVMGPSDTHPEVWPCDSEGERVINKFKDLPLLQQGRKMMNQEGLFKKRIDKLNDQLNKSETENRELELEILVQECLAGKSIQELSMEELEEMAKRIDGKTKEIQELSDKIRNEEVWVPPEETPVLPLVPEVVPTTTEKSALEAALESREGQEWLRELMNPNANDTGLNLPDDDSWFDLFP